jgi:UDP-N-acetylmuramoylalanine--D-glutamate ligase
MPSRDASDDYAGRRVTVMGLGRFGGGIGAVRFLAERGAAVTLTDRKPAGELAESLGKIADLPLRAVRLGEHREEDFTSADLVVASAAIRPDHPCLAAARERGAAVTTEVGLFWRHCPGRIIGVTGSAGKSTTAALIHHLLQSSGKRCWLGGNIGGSLLQSIDEMQPADRVTLELSSFQLQYLDLERRSPEIAVVTGFAPNHLDWHLSLEEYRRAKQTILRWQRPGDAAVLDRSDPDVATWPTSAGVFEAAAMDSDRPLGRFPLPGPHNRRNAELAMRAALAAGATPEKIAEGLATFRGLPHRMEFVGEFGGRRFYNDSKATTPESAVAALQSFTQPVILLAGGSDKGVDLQAFAEEIARRAKGVALMGETGPRLERLVRAAGAGRGAVHVACDFAEAIEWCVARSEAGDVVLLSPGCASFGWFRDYEERGERFRMLAEAFRKRQTGVGTRSGGLDGN